MTVVRGRFLDLFSRFLALEIACTSILEPDLFKKKKKCGHFLDTLMRYRHICALQV